MKIERKTGWTLWFLALISLALSGAAGIATAIELQPVSLNNGAGHGSSLNYSLDYTIGQAAIGLPVGTSFKAGVGFWYLATAIGATGLSEVPPTQLRTQLLQNAPNPFNPSTTIRFVVEQDGPVRLRVYDLQGRTIATLVDKDLAAGEHSLIFRPHGLASGVYLYQLRAGGQTINRRFVLLK